MSDMSDEDIENASELGLSEVRLRGKVRTRSRCTKHLYLYAHVCLWADIIASWQSQHICYSKLTSCRLAELNHEFTKLGALLHVFKQSIDGS
jgi:hypothetical protein